LNGRKPTLGTPSELARALRICRASFAYVGLFSMCINLLLLTPSVYMLAVYDRVMPSSSESTLLMLTLIVVFLFCAMGGLEWIRTQILITASTRLDQILAPRVFDAVFSKSLGTNGRVTTAQPLSDLLQLRQFLTGQGLFAFFDAPWFPIYVLLLFLFHWSFGLLGVVSALVLSALALWSELSTRGDLEQASRESIEAQQFTQQHLRNAEVIEAMGMLGRLRERWREKQLNALALQGRASARSGLINATSKIYRQVIQSLALGLGAYLAIHHEISAGVVISGSILLGRALAPLDLMIGSWKGFIGARTAYKRLEQLLEEVPEKSTPMRLPPPRGRLQLEGVVVAPIGATEPVLKGINLAIESGDVVAIIGPSAAGKSTLVRTMLGLHLPQRGYVRLDGAEMQHWDREQLGEHIGYLPQDVEMLDGSVNENIARFGTVDPDKVVAAADLAGVHEMILRLPKAYDTRIAGAHGMLSAGQLQRLALARALYGEPCLVVLDEPNSNLDQAGDAAFFEALKQLKQRGSTVVVVSHRQNVLNFVDKILVLNEGQVGLYGPRDQVMEGLAQAGKTGVAPPNVAAMATTALAGRTS
jgi:ATP-binding cassette subfamily C protein EexD